MKQLHSFNLTQNKEGQEKPIQYTVILKKPSREEFEEIQLEYASKFGNFVNKGVLTRDLLLNRYKDSGGIFSQKEVNSLIKLYLEYRDTENEIVKISALTENVDEEAKRKLEEKAVSIKRQINSLEQQHADILDATAESMATRKTIEWCFLNLTYVKSGSDEPKLLVEGDTTEDKLKWIDLREEKKDNYVINTTLDKILLYFHLWFMGAATKSEDFKKIEEREKPKDIPEIIAPKE